MTEGQQGRGAVGEDKTLSRRKASQGASKRRLHAWRADGGRGYPESPSLLRRVTVGERKPRLQSNGIVSIYYRVAWQQKKVEPALIVSTTVSPPCTTTLSSPCSIVIIMWHDDGSMLDMSHPFFSPICEPTQTLERKIENFLSPF